MASRKIDPAHVVADYFRDTPLDKAEATLAAAKAVVRMRKNRERPAAAPSSPEAQTLDLREPERKQLAGQLHEALAGSGLVDVGASAEKLGETD